MKLLGRRVKITHRPTWRSDWSGFRRQGLLWWPMADNRRKEHHLVILLKHGAAITRSDVASEVAACCLPQFSGVKIQCEFSVCVWLHNDARWVCGSSTYTLPIDWKWASVWSCTGCFDEASDCIWIAFSHPKQKQRRGRRKEMMVI